MCRRRISNIDNGGDGGAAVLAVERNLSPVGQIIPPLTRIRDTRGWKYLHLKTSLPSYVGYSSSLSVSMEGQPDLTLLSRHMPRLSFVYSPFASYSPPMLYRILRIFHFVSWQFHICQILRHCCLIQTLYMSFSYRLQDIIYE